MYLTPNMPQFNKKKSSDRDHHTFRRRGATFNAL